MQTRGMSAAESITNVVVGYMIALGTQLVVFPLLSIDVSLRQNALISLLFTLVSLARSYLLRRAFNRISGSTL